MTEAELRQHEREMREFEHGYKTGVDAAENYEDAPITNPFLLGTNEYAGYEEAIEDLLLK